MPPSLTWASVHHGQAQEATESNVSTGVQGHDKGLEGCHSSLLGSILSHIHVSLRGAQQCRGRLGHIDINLNGAASAIAGAIGGGGGGGHLRDIHCSAKRHKFMHHSVA